jgi:hypothetical protein
MFIEFARPLTENHVAIAFDMILTHMIFGVEPGLGVENLLKFGDYLLETNEVRI